MFYCRVQYSWPTSDLLSHNKEMKMLYHFDYLPAGLFNRVQVCQNSVFLYCRHKTLSCYIVSCIIISLCAKTIFE